ncbi:DUF1768-domain-containing protein [Pilatotrama ljubarskyi]|nr:DUF1768-domain-containing protein [Pilatotrama ljubarskyi]
MGNNPSRSAGGTQSRPRHPQVQDRSFSKGAWSTGGRRRGYGGAEDFYSEDPVRGEYPQRQAYASPYPGMPQQAFYGQPQYMPGQPPLFPQPQIQPGMNPVIPPGPMTGAIPTIGNPFPAPPLNMSMGAQSPAMGGRMGMHEPVIPGQAQNPEAPVIPPLPSSMRGRTGTPYHHTVDSPYSSDSDEYEDELSPQTRERLQPPLAPGQYGPFDRRQERRSTPAPALRRNHHRRADSSPNFRRDHSPAFARNPEQPPVIPGGMYGQPPFPQHQRGATYQSGEPLRREPSPAYRPRPWTPIRLNHNPLPPPPRDIFQHSPYSRLLQELRKPIDEAAIKARLATAPAIHTVGAIPVPINQPGQPHGTRSSKEKKRKGLFRSLSSRLHSRRDDEGYSDSMSPPQQAYVGGQSTAVYPIVQTLPDGSTTLTYNPPIPQAGMPFAGAGPPPSMVPPVIPGFVPIVPPAASPGVVPAASQHYQAQPQARAPTPNPGQPGVIPAGSQYYQPQPQARATSPNPGQGSMRMPTPQPAPPPPPQRPVLKIDRGNPQYAGLLHTSRHKVHYDHKSYPTVLHLFEALRFLPMHPEHAEEVRRCGTAEEASAIANNNQAQWRSDWETVFENLLDEALYAKFIQHPHLRSVLLNTGDADLVFSDADNFWGEGPVGRGANHLGRALQRVRDRLRAEGVDS